MRKNYVGLILLLSLLIVFMLLMGIFIVTLGMGKRECQKKELQLSGGFGLFEAVDLDRTF